MGAYILEIAYLIASVLYIFGLKMMSDPKTARKGNLWAAAGMTVAVAATIIFIQTTKEVTYTTFRGLFVELPLVLFSVM